MRTNQLTSQVLMVRPIHFGFNTQTAVNNSFQKRSHADVQAMALAEFDQFVEKLRACLINVLVVDDTPEPHTPDSIFPNNWISFHSDGHLVLYPMFANNRRLERKPTTLAQLQTEFGDRTIIDLTYFEREGKYLEGTGSMVLDRQNKIAYACISPRTHTEVLNEFCKKIGYQSCIFQAVDSNGLPIYHTNVMMCIADELAVICSESITDAAEKEKIISFVQSTRKQVIEISMEQMNCFAGNMLQVQNTKNEKHMVMSSQAFQSLSTLQIQKLSLQNKIIHSSLTTIETNGGGSARCMMAEVF